MDSDEDNEEQEQGPYPPPEPVIEDEAQVFEGLRAQFPLSFGRQEPKKASLEAIHLATKRSDNGQKQQAKKGSLQDRFLAPENPVKPVQGPLPMGSSEPLRRPETFTVPAEQSLANDEDDIMVGPPLPPKVSMDDGDGEEIGPPRLPPGGSSTDDEDGDTDGDDQDEDEDFHQVPMSNEVILKGHTKVVSTVAVDPTGTRVLTGSYDYSVRMYDFQGMDSRLQSFRQLEPFEGHQVRALSWSPTADRFLCVTGSAQAKIYDRDGLTLGEFLRGDMYIRDLKNTKGHISGLTGGEWHPKEKQTILTSSEDGSLRIWDVNDFTTQKQVIKPKLPRPGRVAVTACAWGLDGKCMAGGLGNGSVQVWNVKAGWGSRPDVYIEKAHADGDDVSGVKFASDGFTLISRSLDETLKVWDLRSTKAAVKVFSNLPNSYQQTNVVLSPDEELILTGTSVEKGGSAGGILYLFDKRRLELVRKIGVSSHSVVCCVWHKRLNQIFASSGDKKEGGTHILYDPAASERGALCVVRAPRKKSIEDFEAQPVIHHPHALPLFRDEPSRKRQREKARSDPMKSKRPDLPVTGPGFGGRVGTTKGSLLTQYLLKEGGLIKETWMDEDPRAAILKYADVAAKDPKYIAPAYAETQPKTIFASSDEEDEEK
ncbi:hypothetical protein GOP47_0024581 [Adiantum capillus-veneris]|uniref:Transducin/WD40 repeat-like superfamily protein n=1 Tax=Adiantum capillus-veneris TaxID=13818 RepID=A0A9D4Z564_ADICA|nr:hypothetical protein GOP47_0024581 [Adiantum capillus-veneris]